jgi:hypothetical protein
MPPPPPPPPLRSVVNRARVARSRFFLLPDAVCGIRNATTQCISHYHLHTLNQFIYLSPYTIIHIIIHIINSSEEEIGSDEDDNEERVVNESDHDTDSEFEIGQRICKLTQMWTMETLKEIMGGMNISFAKIRKLNVTKLLMSVNLPKLAEKILRRLFLAQ